MGDIQIKNADIDSGNYVTFQSAFFQISLKKNISNDPVDGQYNKTNYDIATADRIGIENPRINIRAYFNTNDFSNSDDFWSETPSTITSTAEDGTSMAGKMTMGYLYKLWRNLPSQCYLKIGFGDPDGDTVYWKDYTNTTTEIPVEITNIDIKPMETSEGNHIITYSVSFIEVKP